MKIGEVCKHAEVSKELVRHYESIGLISSTPEAAGTRTYRRFSPETIERLRLIKKGKQLGLSLSQLKPLLDIFLNKQMSQQQALAILTEQYQAMEVIIGNAREVQALITQSLDKIHSNQRENCLANLTP